MNEKSRRSVLTGAASGAALSLSGCLSSTADGLVASTQGNDPEDSASGAGNESPADGNETETDAEVIPGPEQASGRIKGLEPRETRSVTFDLPDEEADSVLLWAHLQYLESYGEPDWDQAESVSITIVDEDAGVAHESIRYTVTPMQTRQFQVVHQPGESVAGHTIRVDFTSEQDDASGHYYVTIGADPIQ